jgi:multidrug efflux system membrane fusion protein
MYARQIVVSVPPAASTQLPKERQATTACNPGLSRLSALRLIKWRHGQGGGAETPGKALAREPPTTQVAAGRLSTPRKLLLAAGIVLVMFVGWEVLTTFVAYTADAYVQSDLVAFSPQVTGHIAAVHVHDNQQIHKGDLLVSIDPVPFQLAVDARKAELTAANAQVQADSDSIAAAQDALTGAVAARDLADVNQQRIARLTTDQTASIQQLDTANEVLRRARADADAAEAAVARAQRMLSMHDAAIDQAQAKVATAQWQLSQTQLYAPVDGTINNLTVRIGDTAQANEPLIGIVDANAFRIIANYKQSYIRQFQVGATAWVWLDSHPWHVYRARIEGIARGISRTRTQDGLLPYVAPTTDWIRLQRRFPVTLTLVDRPSDNLLFMGADARVAIFP